MQAPDVTAANVTSALERLKSRALATGEARAPFTVQINPAHTVAVASVGLIGDGTDAASNHALQTLRQQVIPAAFAGSDATWVGVTGQTAASADFNHQLKHAMPLVIGFVLAFAFLLLLFAFRSLVVPLLAILLNLLSVAAAYGVLVMVFQHHWADGLLGYTSTGSIANWLPLFLFALLFGLSMDYHVFILSRIREAYDSGVPTQEPIAQGIERPRVSSPAPRSSWSPCSRSSRPCRRSRSSRWALAWRSPCSSTRPSSARVLLPATMALLGERNWYLPQWLRWLPRKDRAEIPARELSTVAG